MTPRDRSDLLAAAEARVFARLREAVDFVYSGRSITACFKKDLLAVFADPPQAEKVAPSFLPRTKGDWPEDFTEENGCYQHRCLRCGDLFFGHKRRCVCKPCFEKPAKPPEQPAVSEAWEGFRRAIQHWHDMEHVHANIRMVLKTVLLRMPAPASPTRTDTSDGTKPMHCGVAMEREDHRWYCGMCGHTSSRSAESTE